MSSSGMAKPMPESYHSMPAVSSSCAARRAPECLPPGRQYRRAVRRSWPVRGPDRPGRRSGRDRRRGRAPCLASRAISRATRVRSAASPFRRRANSGLSANGRGAGTRPPREIAANGRGRIDLSMIIARPREVIAGPSRVRPSRVEMGPASPRDEGPPLDHFPIGCHLDEDPHGGRRGPGLLGRSGIRRRPRGSITSTASRPARPPTPTRRRSCRWRRSTPSWGCTTSRATPPRRAKFRGRGSRWTCSNAPRTGPTGSRPRRWRSATSPSTRRPGRSRTCSARGKGADGGDPTNVAECDPREIAGRGQVEGRRGVGRVVQPRHGQPVSPAARQSRRVADHRGPQPGQSDHRQCALGDGHRLRRAVAGRRAGLFARVALAGMAPGAARRAEEGLRPHRRRGHPGRPPQLDVPDQTFGRRRVSAARPATGGSSARSASAATTSA